MSLVLITVEKSHHRPLKAAPPGEIPYQHVLQAIGQQPTLAEWRFLCSRLVEDNKYGRTGVTQERELYKESLEREVYSLLLVIGTQSPCPSVSVSFFKNTVAPTHSSSLFTGALKENHSCCKGPSFTFPSASIFRSR